MKYIAYLKNEQMGTCLLDQCEYTGKETDKCFAEAKEPYVDSIITYEAYLYEQALIAQKFINRTKCVEYNGEQYVFIIHHPTDEYPPVWRAKSHPYNDLAGVKWIAQEWSTAMVLEIAIGLYGWSSEDGRLSIDNIVKWHNETNKKSCFTNLRRSGSGDYIDAPGGFHFTARELSALANVDGFFDS